MHCSEVHICQNAFQLRRRFYSAVMASFTCTICLEDKKSEEQPHPIEGNPICADCVITGIIPQFEAALHHEHNYPVVWGGVQLQVEDLSDYVSESFIARFRRRELEYASTHRVYCQHMAEMFLLPPIGASIPRGRVAAVHSEILAYIRRNTGPQGLIDLAYEVCGAMVTNRQQRGQTLLACYRCGGKSCGKCGMPTDGALPKDHKCPPKDDRSVDEILHGEQRGRDYQKCPSCDYAMALHDGCNTIRCTQCKTSLCFICGEAADHESVHWRREGGCPRFGQPGAENAIFDAPAPAPAPPPALIIPPGIELDRNGVPQAVLNHLAPLINAMAQRMQVHRQAGGEMDDAFREQVMADLGFVGERHEVDGQIVNGVWRPVRR